MTLRAVRSGGKNIASTYGSNSAGGRDGTDGTGALSEGVPEHVGQDLDVPIKKRKTTAIGLQLCVERRVDGGGWWLRAFVREIEKIEVPVLAKFGGAHLRLASGARRALLGQ